jgi:hypothetical protein
MPLKQQILQELNQLAAQGGNQPRQFALSVSVGSLEAALFSVDSLACALETLTLHSNKLAASTTAELKALSDRLSRQLSYLLEPISLIECDADSATVQLRSNPPQQDEDKTSYYEIVARRGGSIMLCRYLKQPGTVRQITPSNLTHEVLARLGDDFVTAVEAM